MFTLLSLTNFAQTFVCNFETNRGKVFLKKNKPISSITVDGISNHYTEVEVGTKRRFLKAYIDENISSLDAEEKKGILINLRKKEKILILDAYFFEDVSIPQGPDAGILYPIAHSSAASIRVVASADSRWLSGVSHSGKRMIQASCRKEE